MGKVRELQSRSGSTSGTLIRLVVNDSDEDSKVVHFHRARGERRAVRISHPSMLSGNRFPWDPVRPRPSAEAEGQPDRPTLW